MRRSRFAVATVAITALASGSLMLAAASASAVTPGAGAVIFNPDGTPIGSQLVYGATSTPQFVYTQETNDDDFWGLDAGLEPADDDNQFNALVSGIPLGFTATVNGVSYDQAVVTSNGTVCLLSSLDPTAQESLDECDGVYGGLMGDITDPEWSNSTNSYAVFAPLNNDLEPPAASTPVDGADADVVPDSCTFGAYLFEYSGGFYCSAVFWGTTTYEGKTAFAATWYHDPQYDAADETWFNTFQALLVNDGAGNLTVVYNYDEINHEGESLNYDGTGYTSGVGDACDAAYVGGDTQQYLSIGAAAINGATAANSFTDFFGAACAQGVNPQTAVALSQGGTHPLSANSLNSTVAGRYVFRVIDGAFNLTAPAAVGAPNPALAATGDESLLLGGLAIVVLFAGAGLLTVRRRVSIA